MVIDLKIYLDLVFLLNFFIDFLILFSTSKILKNVIKLRKLLLGSLVASSSIFLLFIDLNSLQLFLFKIVISASIILVTFGRKSFFKNISYFYILSIILGGCLYLLNISFTYSNKGILFINNGLVFNFFLSIIVIPIILFCYVKEHLIYKNTFSNIYEVKLEINRKIYNLRGMIDTGNQLKDPYSGKSIILVSNINYNKNFIYVPYKALNTSGIIKCFKPNKVVINNKEFNNCLIGISNDKFNLDNVDCILPNILKEDL